MLGSGGGEDWLAVACPADVLDPAARLLPACTAPRLLAGARRTASARSTGIPAGCARAPVRTRALVVAVGLAVAEDVQGFVLAWRVPCTPVSSMLTAP